MAVEVAMRSRRPAPIASSARRLLAVAVVAVAATPRSLDGACSSLVLHSDGQVVFGCNYDRITNDPGIVFIHKRGLAKTGLGPSTTGVYAQWRARYASVVFSLVGYQQAWAGMNERGLTFSTMALSETANPAPDQRPPLDWLWPQYLLDTCETVDDVIATDALVRTYTVDHYLVADRHGGVAVIEFLDGRMVVHTGPQLCAPVLTNSVYSTSCRLWESLRPTGNYPAGNSSIERFCLAADRVADFSGTTTEAAVSYAFDTLRGIYTGGSHTYTRWSIVFDIANLRAYFKTQTNAQIRWVDLHAFDLRCQRPALMLDMNAGLWDDVSGEFTEYDSDVNRAFMEGYFQRWGIPYTSAELSALLQHLEGYTCTFPPPRRRLYGSPRAPGP
jgi:choloylglycine hydrolase